MKKQKTLFVVFKTVERCNLNCSYCYFFNQGDVSYKEHPPFVRPKTIDQLVEFLRRGIIDLGLSKVVIVFHGGEPTLQPLARFSSMCQQLRMLIPDAEIEFCIQTNGTLINDRWISVFREYDVSVGVSLDGPKQYNDVFRLDHQGRGSYDLTERGIRRLQGAVKQGWIRPMGALCVVDPTRDPRMIYRHFVDNLHFTKIDFLLPDFTYDNFSGASVERYGVYMQQLLSEWIKDNNPEIRLRFFESILNIMAGKESSLVDFGPGTQDTFAITVSSNGELSPDDTLRSADGGALMQQGNIWDHGLGEFLELPIFRELVRSKEQLPDRCQSCEWKQVCRGGLYIHRYSHKNKFNNPSLMCKALKMIYEDCALFLLANGFSEGQLKSVLVGAA